VTEGAGVCIAWRTGDRTAALREVAAPIALQTYRYATRRRQLLEAMLSPLPLACSSAPAMACSILASRSCAGVAAATRVTSEAMTAANWSAALGPSSSACTDPQLPRPHTVIWKILNTDRLATMLSSKSTVLFHRHGA
jgi:hypothetical protein